MKNFVFGDISGSSNNRRSSETPVLQEPHGVIFQKTAFFKVDTFYRISLTLKNGVFWVVTLCGSCKNRRFGGTWRLLHQGDKNR
jgi:hypothetical protein